MDGSTLIAPSRMTIGEARRIAGSLGFPSKMPGTSYGLPASRCITGAKLALIPETVCHSCYALGGRASYQMPRAGIGQHRRLAGIADPRWIDAMVTLLTHEHAKPRIKVDLGVVGVRLKAKGGSRYRWNEPGFHRWHDSGDLQSDEHFAAICTVARRTPKIKHWLPTQELGMVKRHLANGGTIPKNLLVRVSNVMLGDMRRRAWATTSSVYTAEAPFDAHKCPAPSQEHRCGSCRACWSNVAHVAY